MLNIMILFSIIAGIDKILNNRFGLGEKFDEGFIGLGGLALTVIGIYCLSPVIANMLMPILNPLARLMHTDPSVFISSILAPDLGGLPASLAVANSNRVGEFNGAILASILGVTVSFNIPVAVGIISEKDFKYFAKGVLAGIITIPIGMAVAGIMMKIEFKDIILNLLPVFLFSAIIVIGLIRSQDMVIKIFKIVGNVIIKISTLGFVLSIIKFMFNIEIISGMYPLEDGAMLVFEIAVMLSGAYPLFYFISRKLHKYLSRIGNKYELDEYSILGMISCMTSCIPMFGVYDKMNDKGKVLNAAFLVGGSFIFGGQLGYISSILPNATSPFIISKLVAGISAIFVASLIIRKENIE